MSLLHDLVSIKSTDKENINKAMELAAAYLNAHGITGEILKNNGYNSYVAVVGEGEKTLVLNGHLDVVSGPHELFRVREEGGRLYGRGTADMKSGCVAMIEAVIKLKDKNPGCRIMLQLVPDEETGGRNGTAYLVEQGYVGDFVICTEPTNLELSIQSKGIIRVDILTRGVAAHGSRPWEGENAILKAIENYKKIESLPILNEGSHFYKKSSVNLALISGGDIYNRVPDSCTIGLDIRFVPHLNPEKIISQIQSVVDGEISIIAVEHGVNVQPEEKAVIKLSESIQRIMPGKKVKFAAQHGGSDARYFMAKGIPAVEFGPVGNHWHGDEEYVETDSITQLEAILIDFAENYK